MSKKELERRIFSAASTSEFESLALEVFRFQYAHVPVYQRFCKLMNRRVEEVSSLEDIPFLPIRFFKSHRILAEDYSVETVFTSSGTTGSRSARHYVHDLNLYENAFNLAFSRCYKPIENTVVLALLPSYLERSGSSLIYMAHDFIKQSTHPDSGFYLDDYKALSQNLKRLDAEGQNILLIGVSFALLDLVEHDRFQLQHTVVMETGGMKGRRKEMIREELHHHLKNGFGVSHIHSEYGMTELLSQAYSKGDGIFQCPPTMQVSIREPEDPLHRLPENMSGGLNIIDLANLYSCAFIATQDLAKTRPDGNFEVLGRFDNSDIRGCNLMLL